MVANLDGVKQSLEVERKFFEVGHPQVVRDSAKSKNEVVIANILASVFFTGTWPSLCQTHTMLSKIDFRDPCADELSAVQAAPKGRADVAGLEATARNLGEHRSEKQSIGGADQRYQRRTAKLFLEVLSHAHARKSPAQYRNALFLQRDGLRGN